MNKDLIKEIILEVILDVPQGSVGIMTRVMRHRDFPSFNEVVCGIMELNRFVEACLEELASADKVVREKQDYPSVQVFYRKKRF